MIRGPSRFYSARIQSPYARIPRCFRLERPLYVHTTRTISDAPRKLAVVAEGRLG